MEYNRKELENKKIPELKDILREKKLKLSGNKGELVNRIIDYQSSLPKFQLALLPIDILRLIILYLPVEDILNLSIASKTIYNNINQKYLWQQLFLRDIREPIIPPVNEDIKWYKRKIKRWDEIKELVGLIKSKEVSINFIPNKCQYNSFDLIDNLTELTCDNLGLTLPYMPNLKRLDCRDNKLTFLPNLPELEKLDCNRNKLKSLPEFPHLLHLRCAGNKLTSLPIMPYLTTLYCSDNPLPCFTVYEWQKKWNISQNER